MRPSIKVENSIAYRLRVLDGMTPFAKELITAAANLIDKLTEERLAVHNLIGPRPMPGVEYTEKFKAQLYDELCATIHQLQ